MPAFLRRRLLGVGVNRHCIIGPLRDKPVCYGALGTQPDASAARTCTGCPLACTTEILSTLAHVAICKHLLLLLMCARPNTSVF